MVGLAQKKNEERQYNKNIQMLNLWLNVFYCVASVEVTKSNPIYGDSFKIYIIPSINTYR